MQSKYLYSGTYASLLINRLPTKNQRDLLLATTSVAEVRKILQDSCFAPHLGGEKTITEGMDDFLLAQKTLLTKIAPVKKALDVLFLRYDYANLQLIHKAHAAHEQEEKILSQCWMLGTIAPVDLYRAFTEHKMGELNPELSDAIKEAYADDTRSTAMVYERAYLEHIRRSAKSLHDTFISSYVATTIDLYNLQMKFRGFVHTESESIIVHGEIVEGGTLTADEIATLEQATKSLARFGNEKLWQDAVAKLTENHDFTALDLAFDNHLAGFLKQATIDPHTPASLFAYFLSAIEHVQFVRTIIAAHNVGLSEMDTRALVRNSIHDYAF